MSLLIVGSVTRRIKTHKQSKNT